MIDQNKTDDEIINKIKNSSKFQTLIDTIRSKYPNAKIRNSYTFKSSDESSESIVGMNVESNSDDDITLIFKLDNNTIDASISIDELKSQEPSVSHILDLDEDTINIKSFE